jgi:hypothetical protein
MNIALALVVTLGTTTTATATALTTTTTSDGHCAGLRLRSCERDPLCEQAGFNGEKRCADAPAEVPRADLGGAIHVAVDGEDFRTCGGETTACATLEFAARMASPGDSIFLHEGTYQHPTARLTLVGTEAQPIVVTTLGDVEVRFQHATRVDQKGLTVSLWASGSAIVCAGCHHVTFEKIRIDGGADALTFERAVGEHYWSDARIEDVGYSGIQIIDDSTHVTVSETVIHDVLCSAVYLKGVRYATLRHNIIARVTHHCMVGGGAVMYGGVGQVPGNYGDDDPDDPRLWRMDYYGNLVFDVEQRLYSWVKKDNTLTMHIDEGKTLDSQGASKDIHAKFRVAENLVLFPGVLGLRLKRLPGGVVENNSVYVEVDKRGASGARVTENLKNPTLVFSNNAFNAGPGADAIDLRGAQPYEGDPARFHDNYLSGGGVLVAADIRPGTAQAVVDLGADGRLFSDPAKLDFSIAPGVSPGVGVSPDVYAKMTAMATQRGMKIAPTCYRRDHERLTQMIIAAAPADTFFEPTYAPDPSDPAKADVVWKTSTAWSKKYKRYRGQGLVMHLHGEYASELIAWNHHLITGGYIDRPAQHANLDCSRISGSSYCADVRGCTCAEGKKCDQCVNDPDYDPVANTNRNAPVSPVPCVGEEAKGGAVVAPDPAPDAAAVVSTTVASDDTTDLFQATDQAMAATEDTSAASAADSLVSTQNAAETDDACPVIAALSTLGEATRLGSTARSGDAVFRTMGVTTTTMAAAAAAALVVLGLALVVTAHQQSAISEIIDARQTVRRSRDLKDRGRLWDAFAETSAFKNVAEADGYGSVGRAARDVERASTVVDTSPRNPLSFGDRPTAARAVASVATVALVACCGYVGHSLFEVGRPLRLEVLGEKVAKTYDAKLKTGATCIATSRDSARAVKSAANDGFKAAREALQAARKADKSPRCRKFSQHCKSVQPGVDPCCDFAAASPRDNKLAAQLANLCACQEQTPEGCGEIDAWGRATSCVDGDKAVSSSCCTRGAFAAPACFCDPRTAVYVPAAAQTAVPEAVPTAVPTPAPTPTPTADAASNSVTGWPDKAANYLEPTSRVFKWKPVGGELPAPAVVPETPPTTRTVHVSPDGTDDADGSVNAPFATIQRALKGAGPGHTVLVRGGDYVMTGSRGVVVALVGVSGAPGYPITVKRYPGEVPKITFSGRRMFSLERSQHVVVEGLRISGGVQKYSADTYGYAARYFWSYERPTDVGDTCFDVIDSAHIAVRGNVCEDVTQKGVNIRKARYVEVTGNIFARVALVSLSGGDAVHRQWEVNFGDEDPDDPSPDVWRVDVSKNLFIENEQRIFSWIRTKGFCLMELDEGQAIKFDSTQDSFTRSRVSDNLMLWGGTVAVRLTGAGPNFDVSGNSIYSDPNDAHPVPDGITFSTMGYTTRVARNAVHVLPDGFALSVHDAFPDDGDAARMHGNVISGGGANRREQPGAVDLGGGEGQCVFRDPANLDFTVSDAAAAAAGADAAALGVPAEDLKRMFDMAAEYDVAIVNSGWVNDPELMMKIIFANRPSFFEVASIKNHSPDKVEVTFRVTDAEWKKKYKKSSYKFTIPESVAEACIAEGHSPLENIEAYVLPA